MCIFKNSIIWVEMNTANARNMEKKIRMVRKYIFFQKEIG